MIIMNFLLWCRVCAIVALPVASASAQSSIPRAVISEELRLDANKHDFSQLGAVKVSPHGTMALTFAKDYHVRLYDATGRHIATVGRRGSGPGEFQAPQVQSWLGDTVWVFDHSLQRHTFIASNGSVLRTAQLASGLVPARGSNTPGRLVSILAPHALGRNGAMVGLAMVAMPSGGRGPASRLAVVSASQTGESRVVALVPDPDPRWDPRLSLRPQIAFSPDGLRFALLEVDSLAPTGTYSVRLFAAGGDTIFARSFQYTGERIPKATGDSILRSTRRIAGGATHEFEAGAQARIPPVYAPVEAIQLGLDGMVWILMRSTPQGQGALVLDSRGTPSFSVLFPPRSRLAQAGATQVWVKEADQDGLTSLVRYRITWSAPAAR